MRFNRRRCNMRLLLRQSVQVVAPRIELGATRLSAVSGQPALDYHRSRAPRSRTNMENLLLPKQACCHLHLCPCVDQIVSQNGRIRTSGTDRHGRRLVAPGPRPGAISRLRHVLLQWAGRRSRPIRPSMADRCPRLRLFRPVLNRLSYQPNEKSPASGDTGLPWKLRRRKTECHNRR